MRIATLSLAIIVSACGANENGGATPEREESAGCRPGGLEATPAIALVRLPQHCNFGSGGTASAPQVVRSMPQLAQALTCDGVMPNVTDLDAHDLMIVSFSMSPAYGGSEVLDDGTTVTIVTHDRPPCPDDPMPMPTPSFLAFPLPKDAARLFEQASCTLEAHCDD